MGEYGGLDQDAYEESLEDNINEKISWYHIAKSAKVQSRIKCPSCNRIFIKKSYQQAFCSNKGRGNCKDRYWNIADDTRRERARAINELY